jgi:hypothetical protein
LLVFGKSLPLFIGGGAFLFYNEKRRLFLEGEKREEK